MAFLTDLINNVGIISSYPNRYVAILDQDYNPVLERVEFVDVRVKQDKMTMQHPLENGSIMTDYTILRPVEIEVSIIINNPDYQDVYFEILGYYENSTLLTVQTKSAVYENQFLTSIPHVENAEMYNAIAMILRFQQAQIVNAQINVTPKYPSNSDTVNRGQQQPQDSNGQQDSQAVSSFQPNYNIFQ